MSDEPAPSAFDRSELAIALNELAHDHETPLPVPGAEIRRRAVRRRRRRHVSLAAVGVSAVAAVSVVLTMAFIGGEDGHSTPPAATYNAPAPSSAAPVPAATVNLSRRELVVSGRVLPISAGTAKTPTPTGRMTVTGKYEVGTLPADLAGFGQGQYETKAPWVIQLRTPQNRTNYIVAFTFDEKAPGNYDSTAGWIGLRRTDAEWLYRRLDPGAVVAVVGAAPTPTSTPTSVRTPASAAVEAPVDGSAS
ncbi:L,D-transpeptidase [Streptomyces sp. HC44]|uniref:L,D-transpeptidase n=1 Tax=Streptomyces scabichelini TaxID=2711217 RepID=A0A6G4VDS7_9ACTN|nr:L,D-transpeptidase [Streptomyces scabichelini]NGO11943.1 L,D-transpeptidase [Streptomyces scabichelini]